MNKKNKFFTHIFCEYVDLSELYLLLMGIISCGITGRTLAPPFSNISKTPCTAKNLYGSCFSLIPSKKIGK